MARNTVHSCSQCGFQSGSGTASARLRAWNTLVEEPLPTKRAQGARGSRGVRPAAAVARGATVVPLPLREVGAAPVARMKTASASSIASSGAASCQARSCCSEARRGSASRRSPTWCWGTRGSGDEKRCTSAARSRRAGAAPRRALDPSDPARRGAGGAVLAETSSSVPATLAAERPAACVIDSVQTLRSADCPARPARSGRPGRSAARIMELAKSAGPP